MFRLRKLQDNWEIRLQTR